MNLAFRWDKLLMILLICVKILSVDGSILVGSNLFWGKVV